MKKLLLFLSITGLITNAQTPYYKMLGTQTDWYIFQAYIPISQGQKNAAPMAFWPSWGKYTAKNDTLVLGKTYKKFYHVYQYPSSMMNSHVGYIREDSVARRVYILDKMSSSEDLAYDFSLAVGDSIMLSFQGGTSQFPSGYYKVKSISNYTIAAGVRKRFKLTHHTMSSDTLDYVEGVGSFHHPAHLYSTMFIPGQFSWGSGCKYPYALGVGCKYSDNVKQFQSCTYVNAQSNGCIFKYDSCNYWNTCSQIAEHSVIRDLRLAPNPASHETELNINVAEETKFAVDIYDLSGRTVKRISSSTFQPGEQSIKLDLDDVQQGYYFIRISGKDFEFNTPLVVTH